MATFYIDHDNGSNTNPGTRSSPWKSHPYMSTATACTTTGSGPSYPTHTAGDQFIFKGGVTWPAACFVMFIGQGGTNIAQDYYGVDLTYFTGTSFTRPIFDLQNQRPAGDNVIANSSTSVGYITIDNIEIKRQEIPTNLGAGTPDGCGINFSGETVTGQTVGTIVSNVLIHDWMSTDALPGVNFNGYCLGGIKGAGLVDKTEIHDANGTFGGSALAWGGGCINCKELKRSKVHDGWIGSFNNVADYSVHDNEFYNIVQNVSNSVVHTQVIEDDTPCSGPNSAAGFNGTIYNNAIHDNNAGVNIFVRYHSNIYNNVFWNNTNNYPIRFCPGTSGDSSSFSGFVYNNTIDTTGGLSGSINDGGSGGLGSITIQNNLIINPSTNGISVGIATQHINNNPFITASEAATHGYVASRKYSPQDILDTNAINAGLNLTTSCSGNFSGLCSDPEGAPWFGGTNVARPANSSTGTCGGTAGSATPCWDIGAMQHPPSNATPPTVTITAPSNNSTLSGTTTLTATCVPVSPATIQASSFQWHIDNTNFGSAGSVSPYSVTWDTTTASNANHSIFAACVDSNGLSNSSSVFTETVSNNMPGCFVSSNNWSTNQAFTTQTGQFVVAFTVKPNALALDDVVGFSSAPAGAYTDLAAIVRFNPSSTIDVRNAGTYQADNVVSYTAGTVYAFNLNINVLLHTYSVQLTSPSNVAIATNYAFRSEQSSVASLSYVNMQGQATPNTAQFCNLVLNPSTAGPGGSTGVGSAQRFTVTMF